MSKGRSGSNCNSDAELNRLTPFQAMEWVWGKASRGKLQDQPSMRSPKVACASGWGNGTNRAGAEGPEEPLASVRGHSTDQGRGHGAWAYASAARSFGRPTADGCGAIQCEPRVASISITIPANPRGGRIVTRSIVVFGTFEDMSAISEIVRLLEEDRM